MTFGGKGWKRGSGFLMLLDAVSLGACGCMQAMLDNWIGFSFWTMVLSISMLFCIATLSALKGTKKVLTVTSKLKGW